MQVSKCDPNVTLKAPSWILSHSKTCLGHFLTIFIQVCVYLFEKNTKNKENQKMCFFTIKIAITNFRSPFPHKYAIFHRVASPFPLIMHLQPVRNGKKIFGNTTGQVASNIHLSPTQSVDLHNPQLITMLMFFLKTVFFEKKNAILF